MFNNANTSQNLPLEQVASGFVTFVHSFVHALSCQEPSVDRSCQSVCTVVNQVADSSVCTGCLLSHFLLGYFVCKKAAGQIKRKFTFKFLNSYKQGMGILSVLILDFSVELKCTYHGTLRPHTLLWLIHGSWLYQPSTMCWKSRWHLRLFQIMRVPRALPLSLWWWNIKLLEDKTFQNI